MPRFAALGTSLLLHFAAGCQTLTTATIPETLRMASLSQAGSGELDAIRASLDTESWRPNQAWSAEAEWAHRQGGFPVPADLRWKLGRDVQVDLGPENSMGGVKADAAKNAPGKESAAAPEKTSLPAKTDPSAASDTKKDGSNAADKPAASKSSAPWDGFWPLTVTDVIGQEGAQTSGRHDQGVARRNGLKRLKRLARLNNLVGWNAAILWAERDPASSSEVAPILQSLVSEPPQLLFDRGDTGSQSKGVDSVRKNESVNPGSWRPLPDRKSVGPADGTNKTNSERSASAPHSTKFVSISTRCAAAEAWCLVLAASSADPVDGLAPAGRLLERVDLPNEIRAELFRGVSRWVQPKCVPRLENALRVGDAKARAPAELRRAAIEACLVYAIWNSSSPPAGAAEQRTAAISRGEAAWPETINSCRIDPDTQVRRAFVRWVGYSRPVDAFELLKRQAESGEIGLRQTAIETLAVLQTDEARAELRAQGRKTRDALRASVVHALAAWGLQEVIQFARDPSSTVRMAVAAELGKHSDVDAALLLTELAFDLDIGVQLAAVRATAGWPDKLAFPLLLQAMRDSSTKTRYEADQALRARRNIRTSYRFDGPPEEREAAVKSIAAEIGSSLSYLNLVLEHEPHAAAQVNELRSNEVRSHLSAFIENPADSPAATAARDWLAGIGKKDVAVVEAFLDQPTRAPADQIYSDVLPKISPAYAALVDLASDDVVVRRRGAKTLAESGQKATLSRPILARMQEMLAHESDELVWRFAMAAVAADATSGCDDLASVALHHHSPMVRQFGCEYFARHGQASAAPRLLELLEDRNRAVQLAAVRALGSCGNPAAVRGLLGESARRAGPNLRTLLTNPDQGLRFAAAASLCRLGAVEGMQELVRLSSHSNPKIREQAVKAMGDSGQTRFVGQLVSLGWTEPNDEVRRAILENLDRLVPPDSRPAALGDTRALDAKMKSWAEWWQTRQGLRAQSVPAGSPLLSRPQNDL